MKRRLTRRRLLEEGLRGSVLVGGAAIAGLGRPATTPVRAKASTEPDFTGALRAAADEIIPASDGMPAASEVGCVEYLTRLTQEDASIRRSLAGAIEALEAATREHFCNAFARLKRAERVRSLRAFEHDRPETFAVLRDYVYEAYYTRPKVWKLIGYQFYPTNQAGSRMKLFDESALNQVRKKPRYYREIS